MGFDIIHEDEDFFENDKGDIVIDNPPFSKMTKICPRLKELNKPFILMAFSKVLTHKWFQALFKDHLQVIIPFTRPTFTHLTNPKKGYTPPYGVFYFCWKMNLPIDLIILDASIPKKVPKEIKPKVETVVCKGFTKSGKPCQNKTKCGEFCFLHKPKP